MLRGPTHLVDEGGELVFQSLDLLPLLGTHLLDLRVQPHIEGGQEALADGDLRDATGLTHRPTRRPQPRAAENGAHAATQAATARACIVAQRVDPGLLGCAQEQTTATPAAEGAPALEGCHALDAGPE